MSTDSSQALRKVTVLVIEDSGYTARLIKTVLDGLGVGRVAECNDPLRALDAMRSNKPDLVIVDRHMKHLDGLSVTSQIRNAAASPNAAVPIIMLSADVTREDAASARDVGVTEILVKPVSAKAVQERVVHCLAAPRAFVRTRSFRGPDRRRRLRSFSGTERRNARRAPARAEE